MAQRFAVIIGINRYQDKKLKNLSYARSDAEAMYALFVNSGVCGFEEKNVTLLRDQEATCSNIITTMERFFYTRAAKEDEIFVYFSGHGLQVTKGVNIEFYLASYDTDFDNTNQTNAIHGNNLQGLFKNTPAKSVVFIADTCHSGEITNAMRATAHGFFQSLGGEKQVILASSLADQTSQERRALKHGVFTWFVLEGIKGKAADSEGEVTITSLYGFLERGVKEKTGQQAVFAGKLAGKLVLATHPKPLYEIVMLHNFDLENVTRPCINSLRQKQSLIGFAVPYSSPTFLNNFRVCLERKLRRRRVKVKENLIEIDPIHTSVNTAVEEINKQYEDEDSDVLFIVRFTQENTALTFWQQLSSKFNGHFTHRLFTIMAVDADLEFPLPKVIKLKPPEFDETDLSNWIDNVAKGCKWSDDVAAGVIDEWLENIQEKCTKDGHLGIENVYDYLETTIDILQQQPPPTPEQFLEEFKARR